MEPSSHSHESASCLGQSVLLGPLDKSLLFPSEICCVESSLFCGVGADSSSCMRPPVLSHSWGQCEGWRTRHPSPTPTASASAPVAGELLPAPAFPREQGHDRNRGCPPSGGPSDICEGRASLTLSVLGFGGKMLLIYKFYFQVRIVTLLPVPRGLSLKRRGQPLLEPRCRWGTYNGHKLPKGF